MDATLQAALTSGTTAMGSTVLGYIPVVLVPALALLASVLGVKFGFRIFRRFAGF